MKTATEATFLGCCCHIIRVEKKFFSDFPFLACCRTSLFITCSGLYGLFLVVVCIAFLASEVATHGVPLHYFEVNNAVAVPCLTQLINSIFSGSFHIFVHRIDPLLVVCLLLLVARIFLLRWTTTPTNSQECLFSRKYTSDNF